MDYSKSTVHKSAFTYNAFKKFTDQCGGSPEEFADILYARFTVEDFAYGDDVYYWGILGYFESVVIPHKVAVWTAGMGLLNNSKINDHLSAQEQLQFKNNLWLHDLSKFSANEAFGYAMYDRKSGNGKAQFELAWHHHKMNNPHHPEYWLNPNKEGEIEPLSMPKIYLLEMIADWIGAGKTYGSTIEEWLPENLPKFKFKNRGIVAEMIRDFTGLNAVMEDGHLIIE